METLERDLCLYRMYSAVLQALDKEDSLASRVTQTEEVLTSNHLLAFIRQLTQSKYLAVATIDDRCLTLDDQIGAKDVNPIFARLDVERSGLLDWENFKTCILKQLDVNAPDAGFQLKHELGFDHLKEECLYLVICAALLADYGPTCSVLQILESRLPFPSLLMRETELSQIYYGQTVDKVGQCLQERLVPRSLVRPLGLLAYSQRSE